MMLGDPVTRCRTRVIGDTLLVGTEKDDGFYYRAIYKIKTKLSVDNTKKIFRERLMVATTESQVFYTLAGKLIGEPQQK